MVRVKMKAISFVAGACLVYCIILFLNHRLFKIQKVQRPARLIYSLFFNKTTLDPGYIRNSYSMARSILPLMSPPLSTTSVPENKFVFLKSILNDFGKSRLSELTSNADELLKFSNRNSHLVNECGKEYNDLSFVEVSRDQLDHILVDETHKVLFCYVPKVACTNWKRMFMLLTGKAANLSHVVNIPSNKIHSKSLFNTLQNYTVPQINYFLDNFRKFIFVRDPYERLLSAYRNKLEQHYNSSKYFQARFGKLIVRNFRPNATNASLSNGDDVTFTEFVSYLVSTKVETYNEHWRRVHDLCYPCFIRYDVIGRYEVLPEDTKSILDMLALNVSFPPISKPSKTANSLVDYYQQLPRALLDELTKIYEPDFRLFNYSRNLYKT